MSTKERKWCPMCQCVLITIHINIIHIAHSRRWDIQKAFACALCYTIHQSLVYVADAVDVNIFFLSLFYVFKCYKSTCTIRCGLLSFLFGCSCACCTYSFSVLHIYSMMMSWSIRRRRRRRRRRRTMVKRTETARLFWLLFLILYAIRLALRCSASWQIRPAIAAVFNTCTTQNTPGQQTNVYISEWALGVGRIANWKIIKDADKSFK